MDTAQARRLELAGRHQLWGRYAVAVLSTSAALLITLPLPRGQGLTSPQFFAAVLVSAVYGGRGPAILAIVLSVLAINFFIMPPVLALSVDLSDLTQLGSFLLVGLLTSSLSEQLRKSEQEAHAIAERESQARLVAERATRAREEILGIVSHDLRNPLNTISMATALLLEQDNLSPQDSRRKQLEIVRRTTERMGRLIQDLLEVAQIEAGRLSIERSRQEVALLLQEACEMFRLAAENEAIQLELDVDEGLPAVLADHDRILQVLSNLLGNALKFTPEGGRILIRAEPDGQMVRFLVEDTGRGIPPEHLERVFEPYWQLAKGSHRGAGLGLFITKGIVEAHGGKIWATSTPGLGSTLCFVLPAEQQS